MAERENRPPWVITRESQAARFPWAQTVTLDPPPLPTHPLAVKALRAERKLTGWRHLRHRSYAFQVVAALKKNGLQDRPLVLINDPEMTVYLRRHLPRATILHWFENQLESSPRFRRLYPGAADVTAGVSDFTKPLGGTLLRLERRPDDPERRGHRTVHARRRAPLGPARHQLRRPHRHREGPGRPAPRRPHPVRDDPGLPRLDDWLQPLGPFGDGRLPAHAVGPGPDAGIAGRLRAAARPRRAGRPPGPFCVGL